MKRLFLLCWLLLPTAVDANENLVKSVLGEPILPPRQSMLDYQDFVEKRLPRMPEIRSASAWRETAAQLRRDILARAVLRGQANAWSKARLGVQYLDTKPGKGYSIRKLRYEALPGLWIPALLYVPDKIAPRAAVMLAVNGHDRNGKAADYKQTRCINLAKRGMIVLNPEWFGMGQLRQPQNAHGAMNQLDLCGTSGLAPFYLAMTRGLDVLLAHPNADAARVAVSGLSGGGWQTIVVSALDERVTLSNPVAGYSGFRIRLRDHFKDLGDSEQTPVDLATVADYTHLTALRAPRPTLLTYNSKDECCFEAGYALPPLLDAARPIYRLFDKESALRSHVNDDPGTHNFGLDNRQQLYRMVGDFFFPEDKGYDAREIPCSTEIRTLADLEVELPRNNANLNSLAREQARDLPRDGNLPTASAEARQWQRDRKKALIEVLKVTHQTVEAAQIDRKQAGGTVATRWKLRVGKSWTVPVVEFERGTPTKTAILLNDAGRSAAPAGTEKLLQAGYRVLAVDLFYFGEARIFERGWLFALLVSTVGERPLGIQAGQLAAIARWSLGRHGSATELVAVGPRMSLIALCAAAIEDKAIARLDLSGVRASLKEVIEENRTVEQMPEVFCFGLLAICDIEHLMALVAPRQIVLQGNSGAHDKILVRLEAWRKLLPPLPVR